MREAIDRPSAKAPDKQEESPDHARFHLAAIVDSADDAIISKDLTSIIKSWNEAARRMFGYTSEEMVGQSILRLIPDELQYEEEQILKRLRKGERIDHYETKRRRKDGSTIEVSVTISPIRDASGRVVGASKIVRDISDRKRMERLLLQSEKLAATGRMAATVAHEINNPLEALMNLIFLARQSTAVDAKAYRYLLTAENELERVSHIARQTLGYYRETGALAEVDVHELLHNVLAVYKSRMIAAGIVLETQFHDLPKITVSKGEMLQVFSNVISNAMDAMAKGGTLGIKTEGVRVAAGDGIMITLHDNGSGIPAAYLERVFEPFFTTKGDVGTGIGLWVGRQLIEKRGGQIAIASHVEAGKSGTTVTISIPFAVPAMASEGDETDVSN